MLPLVIVSVDAQGLSCLSDPLNARLLNFVHEKENSLGKLALRYGEPSLHQYRLPPQLVKHYLNLYHMPWRA